MSIHYCHECDRHVDTDYEYCNCEESEDEACTEA